jgi:hypothetical protein
MCIMEPITVKIDVLHTGFNGADRFAHVRVKNGDTGQNYDFILPEWALSQTNNGMGLVDAFEKLFRDPHVWSTRPCQTCGELSDAFGIPFGCTRLARERAAQASR